MATPSADSWPSEVIVVEPAKTRYSHAIFNASLLDSLRYAFPATPIRFHAHESHLPWVRESLEVSELGLQGISFVEEQLEELPKHKWKRVWSEWRGYRGLYRRLGAKGKLLVFASVSPSGLFAIKLPMPFAGRHRTLIILHCMQELMRPRTRLRELPLDLQRILRVRLPRHMKLIALGERLLHNARTIVGDFACDWLDIPRLIPQRAAVPKHTQPTFAFVGGTAKGFDIFESLSRKFHNHQSHPRFLLAGFVNSALPGDIGEYIEGISPEPISQEELENRLMQSHYIVWTAEPSMYRLTASATFADAVCFGVPVIALRNSFIEHYFECVGEAGLLCDDAADMAARVSEILEGWSGSSPSEHILASEQIAAKFRPVSIGPRIQGLRWL